MKPRYPNPQCRAPAAQDAAGALKEVTSDDATAMQLRLAPRIAARGSPSWAGAGDGGAEACVRAHVLVALRGAARVDSHLIVSGERGGLVISFADGSLRVTDAAGKVRTGVFLFLGFQGVFLGKAGAEACVRAHVLVALREAARVDSHLTISGERGGLVISFADGSLRVTDAAGKVRTGVFLFLGFQGGFLGKAGAEACVRAHVLVALREAARVDSHLTISGERGGLVISFADGSLRVTDAAGRVRGPAAFPVDDPGLPAAGMSVNRAASWGCWRLRRGCAPTTLLWS